MDKDLKNDLQAAAGGCAGAAVLLTFCVGLLIVGIAASIALGVSVFRWLT